MKIIQFDKVGNHLLWNLGITKHYGMSISLKVIM